MRVLLILLTDPNTKPIPQSPYHSSIRRQLINITRQGSILHRSPQTRPTLRCRIPLSIEINRQTWVTSLPCYRHFPSLLLHDFTLRNSRKMQRTEYSNGSPSIPSPRLSGRRSFMCG